MRGYYSRKLLVLLIVLFTVFSAECKKQPKCGCNGDVLRTLTLTPSTVIFNADGSTIYFSPTSDPLSTYYFCNPGQMFPKFTDYKSGDVLLISGKVFWDCNYLYQSSNYSYYNRYYVYQVQVSEVTTNLYGGQHEDGIK